MLDDRLNHKEVVRALHMAWLLDGNAPFVGGKPPLSSAKRSPSRGAIGRQAAWSSTSTSAQEVAYALFKDLGDSVDTKRVSRELGGVKLHEAARRRAGETTRFESDQRVTDRADPAYEVVSRPAAGAKPREGFVGQAADGRVAVGRSCGIARGERARRLEPRCWSGNSAGDVDELVTTAEARRART